MKDMTLNIKVETEGADEAREKVEDLARSIRMLPPLTVTLLPALIPSLPAVITSSPLSTYTSPTFSASESSALMPSLPAVMFSAASQMLTLSLDWMPCLAAEIV